MGGEEEEQSPRGEPDSSGTETPARKPRSDERLSGNQQIQADFCVRREQAEGPNYLALSLSANPPLPSHQAPRMGRRKSQKAPVAPGLQEKWKVTDWGRACRPVPLLVCQVLSFAACLSLRAGHGERNLYLAVSLGSESPGNSWAWASLHPVAPLRAQKSGPCQVGLSVKHGLLSLPLPNLRIHHPLAHQKALER